MAKLERPSAHPSALLDAALEYLSRGWSVVPGCDPLHHAATQEHTAKCKSPGKAPLVAWAEFQKRRPTEQEARAWWTRWPEANILVVTGAVSGIVVLDTDSAEGEAEVRRRGLPLTLSAKTGKGHHYYFKHPGFDTPNKARFLGKVDFRGDGGYVVAPPSRHASGAIYTWER